MCRSLILLALLGACFDPPPAAEGPYVESHVEIKDYPASIPPSLDMLLVVDNTAAMAPYAARAPELAAAAASTLGTFGHGFPSLRVAVTTNGGVLSPVLSDEVDWFGVHTTSFQGSLESNLAALVDVGASAPGPAQPLDAMRSALVSTELVRSHAYLVVATVAATDDASPAYDYVHFLKSVKSDPANVVVLGMYTLPSPNLDAFHQSFPNRNSIVSIDASYASAFSLVEQLDRYAGGVPCFESNLFDVDRETPGLQPDCNVSAYEDDVELVRVPMCDGAAVPSIGSCWEIAADPINCQTASHLVFQMRGAWTRFHPELRVECVTSP